MQVDQHGLELSGSEAAVERYDRAIHELLHFRAEVIDEARAAVAEDPTFPMGNALRAYLRLLTSEADDAAAVRRWFVPYREALPADELLPRERAHVEAIGAWLDGDMRGAGRILSELTQAYPRDALALSVGHQIDFFTGNALSLRDRLGAALPAWNEDDPHRGPILGMHAFGLEE